MATRSLQPGGVHRRALFGALDADGWTWAGLKAAIWFLLLIVLLAYIPDRAYYFTVGRTVQIDAPILMWSPINLCPAENGGLPCPAPAGAVVPWQGAPTQLALPAGRSNGVAMQLATHLLYVGGTDGTAPTNTTFVSEVKDSNYSAWGAGPALPEARSDAAEAVLTGTAYLIGGNGPDGKPTDTVWSLATTGDKADLGTWAAVKDVKLPEARSGAAAVAVTDGILVAGGRGPDGTPSNKVWKATVDSKGVLGAFKEQAALVNGVADADAALIGEFVWIYGGTDAKGPTTTVQDAHFGAPGSAAPGASGAPASSGAQASSGSVPAASAAAPGASAAAPGASPPPVPLGVDQWAASDSTKLPAPRTGASGFSANGTLYLAGGSEDGKTPKSELFWALPDANGGLTDGWHHLSTTDLPAAGLTGSAPVVSGSTAILIGGTSQGGLVTTSTQASLAPQAPFFQLGLFGAVIPGLQIPNEIGQQLGYIAAAGVGTGNFFLFIILGYVFNHKPQVRAWIARRRGRG
jgi:hypothetical protein